MAFLRVSNGLGQVAFSCQCIMNWIFQVLKKNDIDGGLCSLIIGGAGRKIPEDHHVKLVSFTGSTEVGFGVAEQLGKRFAKVCLELYIRVCSGIPMMVIVQ